MNQLYQFAATYALRRPVALNVRMSRHKPRDVIELSELCLKHNSLDLYLWLSFRFPEFFVEQELCLEQKAFAIMAIEDSLEAHTLNQKFSHSQEYQTVRNTVLNGDAAGLPPLSYGDVRDIYAKSIQSIASKDLYTFPRMSEEVNESEGSSSDKSYHSSRLERKPDLKKHRPPDQIPHRHWMTALNPVSEAPKSITPVNRSAAPTDGVKYQIIYDIATKTYKKINKSEPTTVPIMTANTSTKKSTIWDTDTNMKDSRSWQQGNQKHISDSGKKHISDSGKKHISDSGSGRDFSLSSNHQDQDQDRKDIDISHSSSSNRVDQNNNDDSKNSSYLHYISSKVSSSSGSGSANNSSKNNGNNNNNNDKNNNTNRNSNSSGNGQSNSDKGSINTSATSNNSSSRGSSSGGGGGGSSSSSSNNKNKRSQYWAKSKLNQNQIQVQGQKIADISRATAI